MPTLREQTLLRHDRHARLAHLLFALLVVALVISGLGMGGRLPGSLTSALGGHERLAAWHRQLGLAFGVCFLALPLVAGGRLRQMLVEIVRFHRGELRWFVPFLRCCLWPHRREPPFHDGRYDPAQRIVFLLLGGSLLACTLSGLVLYVAPPQKTLLLAWAIRVHIGASVALIAGAALHILGGSGLLPSHRGVARVMFGDGRVPVALARRLWPGWTARRLGACADEPSRRHGDLSSSSVRWRAVEQVRVEAEVVTNEARCEDVSARDSVTIASALASIDETRMPASSPSRSGMPPAFAADDRNLVPEASETVRPNPREATSGRRRRPRAGTTT